MEDKISNENKSATEYLLRWMQRKKIQQQEDPGAFKREPGLYIGGLKCREGDTIVTDNHGLPHIIRKGCCEQGLVFYFLSNSFHSKFVLNLASLSLRQISEQVWYHYVSNPLL